LFRAYEALDRRLFPLPNDPLRPCDAAPLLTGVPRVAPASLEADLILKLASVPSHSRWRGAAPLGVWSFDHLELALGGAPAFFAELAQGSPVHDIRLRADTTTGSSVLARTVAATHPTSLSRSRHAALWKASTLVGRALRAAAYGAGPIDQDLPTPAKPEPSRFALGRFAIRAVSRLARDRVIRRGQSQIWFVAVRPSRGGLLDDRLEGFVPLAMPADRFYADPFLVPEGERVWLFFEDADRASGKGVIRCSELLEDGRPGESRVVLECDYHLSYPNVFRRDGDWFMLPETSANGTVELWRAIDFPWRWMRERVLLKDLRAVDPTLLEHEGRLWLFVGVGAADQVAADELFAFHADSLGGPWTPHRSNPIVSDARHARPAGPFFREAGHWFRPAQDGSGDYGSGFWLQRVERLDESCYEETSVRRIGGEWHSGLIGTHAIARAGGFDAIDGRLWWRRGQPFPG
jgi:hypothetical protein